MADDIQTQLDALRAQIADLTGTVARQKGELEAAEARAAQAMAAAGPAVLPPGEAPVYELVKAWFSPDDIYYPEGTQFEDITGRVIPNEDMIPLNDPARKRMSDWIASQPSQTRTPPLELIMQAAMELRPKEGQQELPVADFMKLVMSKAIDRHCAAMGVPRETMSKPQTMPRRPDPSVPLMSNTKINGQTGAGARQPATRLRQAATAPADKAAPPTGGRTTNLGAGAHPGVVSSR